MPSSCEHTKPNGQPCRAKPQAGARFCYFHNPASDRARRRASSRGGRRSAAKAVTLPEGTPDVPLDTLAELKEFLGLTMNRVQRGQLDVRVANTLGYLGSILTRLIEGSDLERRLAALEAAAGARAASNGRFTA